MRVWLSVLLVISGAIFACSTTGDLMRETDQASLTNGAVSLSRAFEPWGRDFYNYGLQWGSYWLLAMVLMVLEPESLSTTVQATNIVAIVVGAAGVGGAVVVAASRGVASLIVGGSIVLAPVWMGALPCLSSNVMAMGFLGGWVLVLELSKGRWQLVGSGLFAFLAVACRADAALAMPCLCFAWWGIGRGELGSMLKQGVLWTSGVGAILAYVIGQMMWIGEVPEYPFFFVARTFLGYVVFGIGGVLVLMLAAIWQAGRAKKKAVIGWQLLWVLLMLLPLTYYVKVLYTPRHLLVWVVGFSLSGVFASSANFWEACFEKRKIWFGAVGWGMLIAMLVIGVQLKSLQSGKFVLGGKSTWFPSSDGYWPMGSTLDFLQQLGDVSETPIDHNQRSWGAWSRLQSRDLPEGPVVILSTNLQEYGKLWARWNNRDVVADELFDPSRHLLLGDARSLLRGRKVRSVDGQNWYANPTLWAWKESLGGARVVSEWEGERIVWYTRDGDARGAKFLAMAAAVQKQAGGNGYVLGGDVVRATSVERSWFLLENQPNGEWYALQIPQKRVLQRLQFGQDTSKLAWSEMPTFFDIRAY